MNDYQTTTAFAKIASLKKPLRVIQGGQGAGKTIAILMYFLFLAMSIRKNLTLSIVAESLPNLISGAIRDFERIIHGMGIYHKFKINQQKHTYKIGSNIIEFFSVDGEASRLGSRRTHLYVNECDNIKLDTFLAIHGRTSDFTIVDFNPKRKFYIHTEFMDLDSTEFLQLTYLDNEFLPQGEINIIEMYRTKAENTGKTYWLNRWKVYGLGELGVADGLVLENWKTIKAVPLGAKYLGGCIDYGYASDPTAITKIYKYDGKIILKESLYKKGLLNSHIAKHILNDPELRGGLIISESSEPKTIAELRAYGISIMPVRKGHGSIISGIGVMQEWGMLVTEDSLNLINELENYTYQLDRSGESLGVPIDDFNHCFTGDTLISTTNGDTPIKDIKTGELIHTSKGLRKVLKTFDNGKKEVYKYTITTDHGITTLKGTKDHKIKTNIGWIPLEELITGLQIYQFKYFGGKSISYMTRKDIFLGVQKDFIGLFGKLKRVKSQKDIISTTSIATHTTTISQIWQWSAKPYILGLRVKKELKKILNGLSILCKKVGNLLKNGMVAMKVSSGIKNRLKNTISENGTYPKSHVMNVKRILSPKQCNKNTVQTSANQTIEGNQELITKKGSVSFVNPNMELISIQRKMCVQDHVVTKIEIEALGSLNVYDLMVDGQHEYFANGILVHNCIDGIRYFFMERLTKAMQSNSFPLTLVA